MWNDLILAHERPSDIRDTKIDALRLKFNAFKSLEGEKVNGTFTRLKCLLNDLENNGVIIPQAEVNATFVNSLPRKWLSMNQTQRANNSIKNDNMATLYGKYNYEEGLIDQDSDSDVEEDQRTNNEFMADLNAEYHERALLANHKRYYKRSGRLGSARKPIDKLNKPVSLNTANHQKDYKGKYKGLKAEMVVLTKRIDDLTKGTSEKGKNEKGKSKKGFIAESFDWDEEFFSLEDEGITKIRKFVAIAKDEPSVGKANARSGQWVDITMKNIHRLLSMTDGDERKHADESSSMSIPKITSDSESEYETQEPLPPLPKLIGAAPAGLENKSLAVPKSCSDKKDESSTEQLLHNLMEECFTCGFTDHLTKEHLEQTIVNKTLTKLKAQSSVNPSAKKAHMIPKPFKECKYCRFNDHHSDNYEYYPRCEVCGSIAHELADCPKKHTNSRKPRIANKRSTEPTEKYSKESGSKLIFRDDSLGDIEGYGLVNCNGITFTRVAYVNCLKHNLISISQLCDANFKVPFTKTQGTIFNQNDEVVLIAPIRRDVDVIDMSSFNKESNSYFFAKASLKVNWLCHKRLSLLNFKNINNLAKHNIVSGLPSMAFSKDTKCSACGILRRLEAFVASPIGCRGSDVGIA
ncbi:retrovirus-related pol polyprotein from transposon TNT 1-94 [Tanacetum coccineum]